MDRTDEPNSVDGIQLSSADELQAGKCRLTIDAVTKNHSGLWSCALVAANNDEVLTGEVTLSGEIYITL